LWTRVHVCV